MNSVLFAKMDQVSSLKNKTLYTGKMEKDTGKVREFLSVWKSGNPVQYDAYHPLVDYIP